MTPKARPIYTAEFKAQALGLLALGKPINEVVPELCVRSNVLVPGQGGAQEGGRAGSGPQQTPGPILQQTKRPLGLVVPGTLDMSHAGISPDAENDASGGVGALAGAIPSG